MTPQPLTDQRREICADHLGNLPALQRRAARSRSPRTWRRFPVAWCCPSIRAAVIRSSPSPRRWRSGSGRAARRVDGLERVDMALDCAKRPHRAYETACDLLTARPATT
ncbi:hypothetical protein QJS66_23740 (plasmid) [Kocuria rhizophila]|nr:hypothetical protein QJS66_23740 [Kocuria rhizophila]